jgi:hypothetical protein
MGEPIFMKLGMYIMTPEPVSAADYINPSYQYVCLYVYHDVVTKQRLSGKVTAATNTLATLEELEASFSVLSVLYKSRLLVFPRTSCFLSSNAKRSGAQDPICPCWICDTLNLV